MKTGKFAIALFSALLPALTASAGERTIIPGADGLLDAFQSYCLTSELDFGATQSQLRQDARASLSKREIDAWMLGVRPGQSYAVELAESPGIFVHLYLFGEVSGEQARLANKGLVVEAAEVKPGKVINASNPLYMNYPDGLLGTKGCSVFRLSDQRRIRVLDVSALTYETERLGIPETVVQKTYDFQAGRVEGMLHTRFETGPSVNFITGEHSSGKQYEKLSASVLVFEGDDPSTFQIGKD